MISDDNSFALVPMSFLLELREKLDQALASTDSHLDVHICSSEFDLLRAYSVDEVARMLGTSRVNSVYEISEEELPRVRRIGRNVGYLGINVLAYMHGLDPVDMESHIRLYRRQLFGDGPTVKSLRTEDRAA